MEGDGIVKVSLVKVEVSELKSVEMFGKNDAFAIVSVGDIWKIQTATKENCGSSASWDIGNGDSSSFSISRDDAAKSEISLVVSDDNSMLSDTHIGSARVSFAQILSEVSDRKEIVVPFNLVGGNSDPTGSAVLTLVIEMEEKAKEIETADAPESESKLKEEIEEAEPKATQEAEEIEANAKEKTDSVEAVADKEAEAVTEKAEAKAKQEAEEAEAKAKQEAEEAEALAKKEAEEAEAAALEAEAKAKQEAEEAAAAEAEAAAAAEAEAKAKQEAEEAEATAAEAEAKAKQEAEEAEAAEALAKKEAEEAEAAALETAEAEAKVKQEAEEAEAAAAAEAEATAKREAEEAELAAAIAAEEEAKLKGAAAEAEARAEREAAEAELAAAEAAEAEAKAKKEAEEAEAAAAEEAAAEAKAKQEAEEAEAAAAAEAEAKAKQEAEEAEAAAAEAEAKAKQESEEAEAAAAEAAEAEALAKKEAEEAEAAEAAAAEAAATAKREAEEAEAAEAAAAEAEATSLREAEEAEAAAAAEAEAQAKAARDAEEEDVATAIAAENLATVQRLDAEKDLEENADKVQVCLVRVDVADLPSAETFGKNDPYTVISVGSHWSLKTETIQNGGSSATWDITSGNDFSIPSDIAASTPMRVRVMDDDTYTSDSHIGAGEILFDEILKCSAEKEDISVTVNLTSMNGTSAGTATLILKVVHKGNMQAEVDKLAAAEEEAIANRKEEEQDVAEAIAAEAEATEKRIAEEKDVEAAIAVEEAASEKREEEEMDVAAAKEVEAEAAEKREAEENDVIEAKKELAALQSATASSGIPDVLVLRKTATSSKSLEVSVLGGEDFFQTITSPLPSALHETESLYAVGIGANHDLVRVKLSGTGTNFAEVHVISAARNYLSYSIQTPSAIAETDLLTHSFIVASNNDVFVIKTSNTASGKLELSILSHGSNYQSKTVSAVLPIEISSSNLFSFGVGANHDLFVFTQTGSQSSRTEVTVCSASSHYEKVFLNTATGLEETNLNYEFCVAPNNDVYVLKKWKTESKKTELSVLTATSYYRSFSMRDHPTPLPQTDISFKFAVGIHNELLAIKRYRTVSRKIEILEMTEDSGYDTVSRTCKTAAYQTISAFAFVGKSNKDIAVVMKMGTTSRSTEIHVLSAESKYQKFALRTGTCLPETDLTYTFCMTCNDDLVAISMSGGKTKKTEIMILSAESEYQSFALNTPTILPETNHTYAFAMSTNNDLFVFKKSGTDSSKTEVQVLSAVSSYQTIILEAVTSLDETDESYKFTVLKNRDILVLQKAGCASKTTEATILSASSNYYDKVSQASTALPETDSAYDFVFV